MRIRLPEALKASVQSHAAENRRSMNAEIVRRLEWSIAADAEFAAYESVADDRSRSAAKRLRSMSASAEKSVENRLDALESEFQAFKAKYAVEP